MISHYLYRCLGTEPEKLKDEASKLINTKRKKLESTDFFINLLDKSSELRNLTASYDPHDELITKLILIDQIVTSVDLLFLKSRILEASLIVNLGDKICGDKILT
jgi:catalase (peroxidase I)